MPLTVEDGTGLAAADSYISEANARTYVSDRYPTSDKFLTNTDVENEPFLRRAVEELDGRYRLRYLGFRADTDQGLEWPRVEVQAPTDFFPFDPVTTYPGRDLGRAQTEVARRLVQGTDVNPDQSKGGVTREKVDVIEVNYATPTGRRDTFIMPQVRQAISRWIRNANIITRA